MTEDGLIVSIDNPELWNSILLVVIFLQLLVTFASRWRQDFDDELWNTFDLRGRHDAIEFHHDHDVWLNDVEIVELSIKRCIKHLAQPVP